MTAHAETLTPQLPERFTAVELEAAARWVNARCTEASPALLVDTFRAVDAILAKSRGVVALRNLMPGSGLEVLYLPSERDASAELASLPGKIHQVALTAIGRALRAEFIATRRDMAEIEADNGARLIVHAVEVRALVLAAAKVELIDPDA
ncbi:hypothetical protein LM497_29475 [Pseudomonas aeruginosa]|uniref:hypothetical protein n=1 Tax=Pseudomonas aeruginosa TaxID=287 RepID=UPI002147FA2E|nr:hypothetical protein [Pseudomonas aeruginosa]MCQ9730079.1 hypothetical protein [Pseudomonas aeruginosa]